MIISHVGDDHRIVGQTGRAVVRAANTRFDHRNIDTTLRQRNQPDEQTQIVESEVETKVVQCGHGDVS